MTRRASVGVGILLAIGAAARNADAQGQRDADRYDQTFRKYSKRYFGVGYDWRVFKAQAMAESEMNPDAKSWVGARGLMQLMPSTYKDISLARNGVRIDRRPRVEHCRRHHARPVAVASMGARLDRHGPSRVHVRELQRG